MLSFLKLTDFRNIQNLTLKFKNTGLNIIKHPDAVAIIDAIECVLNPNGVIDIKDCSNSSETAINAIFKGIELNKACGYVVANSANMGVICKYKDLDELGIIEKFKRNIKHLDTFNSIFNEVIKVTNFMDIEVTDGLSILDAHKVRVPLFSVAFELRLIAYILGDMIFTLLEFYNKSSRDLNKMSGVFMLSDWERFISHELRYSLLNVFATKFSKCQFIIDSVSNYNSIPYYEVL